MSNLFFRLKKIEEEMESRGETPEIIHFKDGTIYEMTKERVWPMFSDAINKKENADLNFFLKQLERGNPDERGLVHSLSAYAADLKDIFADEFEE